MKFIDYAKILIKSGDGGKGIIAFHREKFVPKGGPDGGNGGRGGDVIFVSDSHLNTLLDFKYRRNYQAENGDAGGNKRMSGKDGEDLTIRVPTGTAIKDSVSNEVIADLDKPEMKVIIARGGKGGRGNIEFATSTNQTPRFAEDGKPGEELEIILELKLIADVGLVGFPNVGKSTLISVISAAKPKIADYPFTTLIPNLGIVKVGDYKSFTVADIPGLIEGASDGKGLGIQFLRHVERTDLLVFLIESTSTDPKKDYKTLLTELTKYNPEMKAKDKIICFSKCDILSPEDRKELEKVKFGDKKNTPILFISSITHESIDKLVFQMWNQLSKNREQK